MLARLVSLMFLTQFESNFHHEKTTPTIKLVIPQHILCTSRLHSYTNLWLSIHHVLLGHYQNAVEIPQKMPIHLLLLCVFLSHKQETFYMYK